MFIGTCCMATDRRAPSKKTVQVGAATIACLATRCFQFASAHCRGLPWRESPDVYWMMKSKQPQKDNDENVTDTIPDISI